MGVPQLLVLDCTLVQFHLPLLLQSETLLRRSEHNASLVRHFFKPGFDHEPPLSQSLPVTSCSDGVFNPTGCSTLHEFLLFVILSPQLVVICYDWHLISNQVTNFCSI